MATYDDFLTEIRVHAYAVPEPVVELYVRRAAIKFCEKTRVYQRVIQEYAFANEGRIDLSAYSTSDETFESVEAGWYLNVPLDIKTSTVPNAPLNYFAAATFGTDATFADPKVIFSLPDERDVVGVWPVPKELKVDAFTLRISLKPSNTTTIIPEILLRDHNEAIVDGALSYILAIQNQPWTNGPESLIRKSSFAKAMVDARIEVDKGRSATGDQSVQMRAFG
jgi:hypothetical protein